jgi:hypothetical protein
MIKGSTEESQSQAVDDSWIEFPDPVITSFMDRVRNLPPGDRSLLDIELKDAWGLRPKEALSHVRLWARMYSVGWTNVKISLGRCDNAEARIAYKEFLRDLLRAGWSYVGVGIVFGGLGAIRLRRTNRYEMIRAYDRVFGNLIGRRSIGWADPAA